ncbi:MAG: tRNA (cytidine(34)-2'-O)-methyltransferase [Bacilli bacterium]|jgi:tRNA (cytidine/uridine-2'-O-)-methyltransferase
MINIVLYQPEIPQNTGNIMRTCLGGEAKLHLIKPLGFSLNDKYLKRSGLDYFKEIDYELYENYDEFCSKNKGTFYFITRYGKKLPTSFSYVSKENIYFIFGSESRGVPKNILQENINNCIRIPITTKIRTLNLSNCVSIMIYEALRQQDYEGLSLVEPFKGSDYLER